MEQENKSNGGLILSIVSFFSAVISIFTMYYLFAVIALITGMPGLKYKNTKGLSIATLIIVAVSFVIKVINLLITEGSLPAWFMNGMI